MEKASDIRTPEKLIASEGQLLLLRADGPSVFDMLAGELLMDERFDMYGETVRASCVLYPLFYSCEERPTKCSLTQSRMMAVRELFYRWETLGLNKHHAKKPFASKAFQGYLNSLASHQADYLLLLDHAEIIKPERSSGGNDTK